MSRLRTFLAVPLSDELRNDLVGLQCHLATTVDDIKWVDPANLHVTLVFLGDVAAEMIPAICTVAQEAVAEMSPFSLGIQTLGCFPNTRRPRILWAGVSTGANQLMEIHERLARRLEGLGFPREARAYTPHITLGRAKGQQIGPSLVTELEKYRSFETAEIEVDEVEILSSQLTRQGSRYQVLGRAKLQG